MLLGFGRLRDLDYYSSDPMALRVTGLKRAPSLPTVSRLLPGFDARIFTAMRECLLGTVLDRFA